LPWNQTEKGIEQPAHPAEPDNGHILAPAAIAGGGKIFFFAQPLMLVQQKHMGIGLGAFFAQPLNGPVYLPLLHEKFLFDS